MGSWTEIKEVSIRNKGGTPPIIYISKKREWTIKAFINRKPFPL